MVPHCWNLFSSNCERFYKTWNVACRIILHISNTTHRYLIEPLSNCLRPKVIMSARFIRFHQSLIFCKKPLLRMLANFYMNDLRSIYGSNLYKISNTCGVNITEITPYIVEQNLIYFPVPEQETWRIPAINELLSIKAKTRTLEGFTPKEVDHMLFICCSS